MKELSTIENYAELKETLRDELNNQSLGFVRTGYLLKRARDTGMIEEGGYKTVFEFAEAEYGLKKDVVSRYIAINDRYSEGGYSDKLQEQFREYGVGKLQDMLTLPMEVVNMLSPQMTRSEIGELKAEIKAEEAVTPMELLMEGKNEKQCGMDICQKAMHQYCYDYPWKFVKMADAFREETDHATAVRLILDAMAPSGIKIVTARVQGEGRFMISFQGENAPVEIKQVKGGEYMTLPWTDFLGKIREVLKGTPGTEGAEYWESIYQEAFPQEEDEKTAPEPEKESKRQQDQEEEKPGRESVGEEPEKEEVAPVQQNPKEEVETPIRQQDSQEETPEEPEEVLSGEVEEENEPVIICNQLKEEIPPDEVKTAPDGVNTEHEPDSVKMTEEKYEKQMQAYFAAFEESVSNVRISIKRNAYNLALSEMRDATKMIQNMQELYLSDWKEEEEE